MEKTQTSKKILTTALVISSVPFIYHFGRKVYLNLFKKHFV